MNIAYMKEKCLLENISLNNLGICNDMMLISIEGDLLSSMKTKTHNSLNRDKIDLIVVSKR